MDSHSLFLSTVEVADIRSSPVITQTGLPSPPVPNCLAGRKSTGMKHFEVCQVMLKLQTAEADQSTLRVHSAKSTSAKLVGRVLV